MLKKQIRDQVKASLKELSEHSRNDQSAQICKQVIRHPSYLKANYVGIFLSMPQEVATLEIITSALGDGKRVFVPKVTAKQMTLLELSSVAEIDLFHRTPWGIPEPPVDNRVKLEDYAGGDDSVMIVPAVAYNTNGKRLGHGGGYYDRYLNAVNSERKKRGKSKMATLGIALHCQRLEIQIPTMDHDVDIDDVLFGQPA